MDQKAKTQPAPQRRSIRLPDVMARTCLSKTTIWRHARKGAFPKSVTLTTGTVAWVETDIENWIAARIASRDASSATR